MIFGKHINKYHLKYLIFFLIGVAALIACDWFQLELPEILGKVVELVQKGHVSSSELNSLLLQILKVGCILLIGRMIWRFSLFYASTKIEANIRHDMYLKAERLSSTYYQNNKVGNVMSWMTTDLETLEEYIGWGTLLLVDGVFLTFLALLKMFQANWALSLISLFPILLIAVWGALVEKYMTLKWKARQESADRLYDYSQESFTGIRVIKAFVKENQQIHRFSKIAKQDQGINVDFVKLSVTFDVIIEVIIAAVFAILMGFGSWFVWATVTHNPIIIFNHTINLKAPELITFIGYFDTLIWPMIALGQVVTLFSKARASFSRINRFLDSPEDIQNPSSPIFLTNEKGDISFNHLTFTYPGSKNPSLKDITLNIKAGETVGIIGRVGSGKTTLVNILLRLYNIPENSVLIGNHDLMQIDLVSLREHIAYVPQDNFLFSDTVANNVAFSKEKVEMNDVNEATKFADVYDNVMDFPNQFETTTGERGQTLSGGQKQRISIARAFLKKSPILILDDSVSAVDVSTEETILKNIHEQRQGQTTLIIASRATTVSHLDKIIVLNDGELEAFDSPKNLLKTSPTYQRMVALQELEKAEGGQ